MGRIRKIAFEEHFTTPDFAAYSKAFVSQIDPDVAADLSRRLLDVGELRLKEMDDAGIEYVILSQTGPSVQAETDVAKAISNSKANNDYLAEKIAKHPTRFGGFATLPMQDPAQAIKELERAVKELGFKGTLVNGHTLGVYYDAPQYDEFWACLQELDVPFYLHPFYSYDQPYFYEGHPELTGATWGWGVETATHALRILFGGVFDRHPGAKVVVGHMGEGCLPYLRWRFDSRFSTYPCGVTLARKPTEYIGSNILITTSGVCSHAALTGAIGEMGADAVMFSVDYPYESTQIAAEFIETAPLDEQTRAKVCYENAKKLFKL